MEHWIDLLHSELKQICFPSCHTRSHRKSTGLWEHGTIKFVIEVIKLPPVHDTKKYLFFFILFVCFCQTCASVLVMNQLQYNHHQLKHDVHITVIEDWWFPDYIRSGLLLDNITISPTWYFCSSNSQSQKHCCYPVDFCHSLTYWCIIPQFDRSLFQSVIKAFRKSSGHSWSASFSYRTPVLSE